MIDFRIAEARQYLDDARYLYQDGRYRSAVSRAYYASYQALWGALDDPPTSNQWRHLAIISHFVRGRWVDPNYPLRGPGLFEHLRIPLNRLYQFRIAADYEVASIDAVVAEECLQTVENARHEIDSTRGGRT